ncbi:hypothetical protein [Pseudomonas paralcaligenes]|uniref:hypothetical protein n=1 Tax=Pseudomonas paralcaligenes TaxID=2772558 RepID=UPI001C7FB1C8|nr:hypothetical protein [Pseudomonas paralcaligenes]
MTDYLLIGGPCAGQVVKGHEDADHVKVTPRLQLASLLVGLRNQGPVTEVQPFVVYRRLQITEMDGTRHVVMVAPGVDPIQELLRVYEKTRGGKQEEMNE